MIFKILGLFVNTLTADDKYSVLNTHNFIATSSDAIISETKETSAIFFGFRKSRFNFEQLRKKDDPHS